ncbi:MAG: hypothetical protein QF745_09425 [Planctomycetota bacterium]|nr:hypothetical protein [Planctomycetota bacterium]
MQVTQTLMNVSGGFSTGFLAVNSIGYTVGDTTHTFVQLDKNAPWFLKGVGGPKIKKGELKAVDVIQDIRDEFHIVGGEAAVAGEGAQEDDPMDGLDDVVETLATNPKARNRNKHTKQSVVRALTMPMRPLCAAPEAKETKIITVYRKAAASEKPGSSIRNNTALYVRTDCLDWLLSYAADELYFQGVVPTIETAPQSRTGNCPEVNDLYLEWDFGAKSWDAKFVAGTFENTTKRLSIKDLDKDRWSKLQKGSPHIGDFSIASRVHVKSVAKLLITNWCKAIAGNKCAEFEKEWGLGGTNLETPPKKRRRRDEPAGEEKPAVADFIENESAVADLSGADED